MSIRIGIYGYGNLARGVEASIRQNPDMELCAVFTRRDPASLKIRTAGVPVLHADDAAAEVIRFVTLCGDLQQTVGCGMRLSPSSSTKRHTAALQ